MTFGDFLYKNDMVSFHRGHLISIRRTIGLLFVIMSLKPCFNLSKFTRRYICRYCTVMKATRNPFTYSYRSENIFSPSTSLVQSKYGMQSLKVGERRNHLTSIPLIKFVFGTYFYVSVSFFFQFMCSFQSSIHMLSK